MIQNSGYVEAKLTVAIDAVDIESGKHAVDASSVFILEKSLDDAPNIEKDEQHSRHAAVACKITGSSLSDKAAVEGVQRASCSYSIKGGIAPKDFGAPTVFSFDMPPTQAQETSQSKPKAAPFFQSFTNFESGFTFSSTVSMPSVELDIGGQSSLAFPTYPWAAIYDPSRYSVFTVPNHGRTIFDDMHDRHTAAIDNEFSSVVAWVAATDPASSIFGSTNTDGPSAHIQEATVPLQCTSGPKNDRLQVSLIMSAQEATYPSIYECESHSVPGLSELTSLISLKLTSWAKSEAERLQRSILDDKVCLKDQAVAVHEIDSPVTALVRYNEVSLGPSEQQVTSMGEDLYSAYNSPTWDSGRIFFATPLGHTRLVDFNNPMYSVDVTLDDGASDFDSIASPIKSNPKLALIHEETESTSSEESLDDLYDHSTIENWLEEDVEGTLISTGSEISTEYPCPSGSSTPALSDSPRSPEGLSDNDSNSVQDVKTPQPSTSFASDWASELVRTTLGTESLFTFLQHLKTSEEGTATKLAIAAAYLELVDLERKKMGERALPKSYSASAVMASGIMPHTIFLGTVSLASLMSQVDLEKSEDTTTIEEIYRVFKMMSKEDSHHQVAATTGIMGMLGRKLGRIPMT
jgi:hypothetical protein